MTNPLQPEHLQALGMTEASAEDFLRLYREYRSGPPAGDDWGAMRSPDPAHLPGYETLPEPAASSRAQDLSRLVVLKLNGGLGTGMGCPGPKSIIPVKQGKTFLDLIVEQLKHLQRNGPVPLVLMNSFYTHQETQNHLAAHGSQIPLFTFQQNRFPRLDASTHLPVDPSTLGDEAWYPPGHGDLYACLAEQGWLDRWLQEGREVLFVSNADNLGAVVDSRILRFILEAEIPFLMEMTQKTPADVKGGTLYQKGERLHLLEFANVPEAHVEEFRGKDKFCVFNTNNIWIHLRQLKARLEEGPLDLGVIVNTKEAAGRPVIQLETAVGSGLENFSRAVGLVVPRDRFLPVKTTSDLLLVQSDLFLEREGTLVRNPKRASAALPQVHLGEPFQELEGYQRRLPVIPSLLDLDCLTLEGDVRFKGVAVLRGTVSLQAHQRPMVIPKGAVLENEKRQS